MVRRLTIAITAAAYLLTYVIPLPLLAQEGHHHGGHKEQEEIELEDIPGIDLDGNLTADEVLGDMLVKASINTETGKTRATGTGHTVNDSGKRQKFVNEDEIEGFAIYVLILMMSPLNFTYEQAVRTLFAVKADGKVKLKVSATGIPK